MTYQSWIDSSLLFLDLDAHYWVVQWSWFARVNALCILSHKKSQEVAASLLGQFLCRHCFILCITLETEHRILKQYNCHHYCSCKNYQGKKGGKTTTVFASFFGRPEDSWKKCVLGHPTTRATHYCLLPDTFWLRASKNAFKVGSENLQIHCHHLPLWRKYVLAVKAAKGLKPCLAKVKGVNSPTWTTQ